MDPSESTQQSGDQRWRYGVVGGLLAAPSVALSYWQTGSEVSVVSVALVALLVGYVAKRRSAYGDGIGARVGVVGGLPILWASYDFAVSSVGLSNPSWFTGASLVLLGGFTIVGFGMAGLLGEVGARVGGWLADRTSRSRRVAHS
ncbi:DUF5518 domain-containing protein [Halobaculum sp. MBLA0143]|uniref:DUF5518 domain-containing protein n=1 Tax=Halobaculum sp. MBLA0143 TaxID=3079933 RepID=UPI0035236A8F